MGKKIAYSKQAIKTLAKLPANQSTRIRSKLRQYADDPASQVNNVKKLQGREAFRLRVGDWRVLFDENDIVIDVIRIGARGDVYRSDTMNTAVSFKTPNGEDMIVLSKSDYETLLERAELVDDVAAVDAYGRKLAAGEEEAIPEEFADRLIDGENPVRVYRELRGLSAKELAERTGISAAFLSEIENGKKEGGVSTLKRIAAELNVMLDDLVLGK